MNLLPFGDKYVDDRIHYEIQADTTVYDILLDFVIIQALTLVPFVYGIHNINRFGDFLSERSQEMPWKWTWAYISRQSKSFLLGSMYESD